MDYSRLYVGDTVLYQGQVCANSVTTGSQYPVVEVVPDKPRYGFILDESGRLKLIQMGYLFAKIGGT